MPHLINIPIKVDSVKWFEYAENISNWPNNERTRYFHSRLVPDELRDELAAQFKIPFDIATFHKHFPNEGYKWHKDIDRQTVAICQISPDNSNVFLEFSENDVISRYDYSRGNFILLDGQILHRVVNIEPVANRYIITMGWHKKKDNIDYHAFNRLVSLFNIGELVNV